MFKVVKTRFTLVLLLLLSPLFATAQTKVFNVDPSYDAFGRQTLEAELIRETPNIYFYIERNWWNTLTSSEQNEIKLTLFDLGEEFRNKIYPTLTSTFGSEPKPGIDKDEKITVLLHQIRQDAGGYSNSGDVYSRFQAPKSNEREMIYLNSLRLRSPNIKSILAHEFMHLITVNQKDLLRRVTEETWLNEARAEYIPTLLGYDNSFSGSNLEKRVKDFLENPNVSLTEWTNSKFDYAAVNLFIQYLVDHYGVKILSDSLQSSKIGIASLEEALQKNGIKKDFHQIFSEWSVALLLNDCRWGESYCYFNQNLLNLRIVPTIYFLPKTETVLTTMHGTTYWALNWHRFVGGGSNFILEFEGGNNTIAFDVLYVICDKQNKCLVGSLVLDSQQKGKLSLVNFDQNYNSLTIIPFIKSKTEGFDGRESNFTFSWKVSVSSKTQTDETLRNQLLAQISELQEQVRQLQLKIAQIKGTSVFSCQRIGNNLYYGMRNNQEVRCLQEFLKAQGLYPEGLITGNFLSLTQAAVIRFQEKYALEILAPLGLTKGTGFVGSITRAKINQLIK
jgi:hypothetical protein